MGASAAKASYHLSNDRTLTLIHFVMFLPEMRFQVEIDKKKGTHTAVAFYLHFARKISTHKNEPQYRPCSRQIISMSFFICQKWATEWIGILSYFTGGPFGPDRIRKHNFLHFFSSHKCTYRRKNDGNKRNGKKEPSLWAISTQISTSLIIKPNRFYAY